MAGFKDVITDKPKSTYTQNPEPDPIQTPSHTPSGDRIYSDEENINVNAIIVTIPDRTTPIAIFFGAPSSGKTMTLIRMIRFLEQNGYTIVPERVFRPQHDMHYQRMCNDLKSMAYSNYAPHGNDIISFMLLKVLDSHGHPVCQILEAPGEHYFNEKEPNASFPTYIQQFVNLPNPKTWVFFCEQDWGGNQNVRNAYAQAIQRMEHNINRLGRRGKVVFLFNKADKFPEQYNKSGYPVLSTFFNNIANQYPGIFDHYKNFGLMKILHGPYAFKALCFSSGSFSEVDSQAKTWNPGDDWYCQQLWNALK